MKSLQFVNKKTIDYISKLNPRDFNSLQNFLKLHETLSNSTISYETINKEQFKKVAIQVQFLGYDKDYCMIFGIYGPKIDKTNKNLLTFTLSRIIHESFYIKTKIQGEAKGYKKYCTQGITLIFFNNCTLKKRHKLPFSSKEIFEPLKIDEFKHSVIKELETNHLIKINHVFLVYPSLLTKSWNYLTSFGLQNSFFDTYFTYLDSIYDLVQHLGPLFEAHKIDSSVLSYDSSVSSKNWKNFYSQSQKAHSFEELASYEKMCELSSIDNLQNTPQFEYKKSLDNYLIDEKTGVPLILTALMDHIIHHHLGFEGLFRKVADERELIRFQNFVLRIEQQALSSSNPTFSLLQNLKSKICDFEVETITSFFKKVFIQLQQPIISEQLYTKLLDLGIGQIDKYQFPKQKQQNSKLLQETNGNKVGPTKSMTASFEPNSQNSVKGKVWQKVAFFENLSQQTNCISKTVLPNVKATNETKITFKKVPNGRKLNTSYGAKKQQKDIFNFTQMKRAQPLEYKTLKQVLKFLNAIKREEKHNLMSASNLAICFNPCFFRKLASSKKLIQLSIEEECQTNTKLVKILERLIENEDLLEN